MIHLPTKVKALMDLSECVQPRVPLDAWSDYEHWVYVTSLNSLHSFYLIRKWKTWMHTQANRQYKCLHPNIHTNFKLGNISWLPIQLSRDHIAYLCSLTCYHVNTKTLHLPWDLIKALSAMLTRQNGVLALYAELHHYLRQTEKKTAPRIKGHCLIPALLPLTVSLFILPQAKCQMFLVHWAWESGSQITHSKLHSIFHRYSGAIISGIYWALVRADVKHLIHQDKDFWWIKYNFVPVKSEANAQ